MDGAILRPGDIFLTRGTAWISRAIRFFSKSFGEPRTEVNHVGLVVEGGDVWEAVVVEALSKVGRHRLRERYGPPVTDHVAVFRPLNLTPEQIDEVVAYALKQVGRNYGYPKIIAHLLDWCLMGAYVFRRLTVDENYPICSWLVAHAFSKIGKNFGVDQRAASPDDIWDFVTNENRLGGYYEQIRELAPLTKDAPSA